MLMWPNKKKRSRTIPRFPAHRIEQNGPSLSLEISRIFKKIGKDEAAILDGFSDFLIF